MDAQTSRDDGQDAFVFSCPSFARLSSRQRRVATPWKGSYGVSAGRSQSWGRFARAFLARRSSRVANRPRRQLMSATLNFQMRQRDLGGRRRSASGANGFCKAQGPTRPRLRDLRVHRLIRQQMSPPPPPSHRYSRTPANATPSPRRRTSLPQLRDRGQRGQPLGIRPHRAPPPRRGRRSRERSSSLPSMQPPQGGQTRIDPGEGGSLGERHEHAQSLARSWEIQLQTIQCDLYLDWALVGLIWACGSPRLDGDSRKVHPLPSGRSDVLPCL